MALERCATGEGVFFSFGFEVGYQFSFILK